MHWSDKACFVNAIKASFNAPDRYFLKETTLENFYHRRAGWGRPGPITGHDLLSHQYGDYSGDADRRDDWRYGGAIYRPATKSKVITVEKDLMGPLTTPPSIRGIPSWATYLAAVVGMVYLLNPTGGLIEIIPDIIPIVGNLDEGVAMVLIWYGLVEFFEGRKK